MNPPKVIGVKQFSNIENSNNKDNQGSDFKKRIISDLANKMQSSQPSQRLQMLKPKSLIKSNAEKAEQTNNYGAGTSPISVASVFTLNTSKFATQKSSKKKHDNL